MSNVIVPTKEVQVQLRDALYSDRTKAAIKAVLPKHLTADRMIKVAFGAAMRTPTLLKCTPASFVTAVVQASELGLEPGSALGHAYLVPYWNSRARQYECQMIPGYRGLIALARRSGEIVSLTADVVHARDQFYYRRGIEERLEHVPFSPPPPAADSDEEALARWMLEADPGPIVAAYAVAKLRDGGVQFEVMNRAQLEKARAFSESKKRDDQRGKGPWHEHFDEMCRKTLVRRLFKYLPVSIELSTAFEVMERAEGGEGPAADLIGALDAEPTDNAPAQLPQGRPSATDQLKGTLKQNLRPVAAVAREPGGDDGEDDPPPFMPPTGSDSPRGGASNDADATGTSKETAPATGAQALAGPVTELRAHLEGKPRSNGSDAELAGVVGAWLKRRQDLVSEGLGDEALDVVRTELRSRGCGDPDRFIQGVVKNQKRTGT